MARFSDKAGDVSAFEWRGLGLEPLNCVNSGMQLSDQIYPADPVRRLGDQPAEFLGMAASHRFQPSRRRTFAATSLTASTGLQPTGRALPPLVPTGLAPDQHWQRACFGTEHPLAQLPNLPPKLLQAAEHLESLGGGIVSWRKEQMKRIRRLAESLQPVQAQWQQGLHPQVRRIIGKWHLPLLHILAKEAGSEDLFFNLDYSAGVRCVGRAAHSFVMPLKFTRPTLSVEALLSQAKVRNHQLIASVRSSAMQSWTGPVCRRHRMSWIPRSCWGHGKRPTFHRGWQWSRGVFLSGSTMGLQAAGSAGTLTRCQRAWSTPQWKTTKPMCPAALSTFWHSFGTCRSVLALVCS